MRQHVAQFNLELLGGLDADIQMVFTLQGRNNCLVHGLTALKQRFVIDQSANRDHAYIRGAATNVDDHAAIGLTNIQPLSQRYR